MLLQALLLLDADFVPTPTFVPSYKSPEVRGQLGMANTSPRSPCKAAHSRTVMLCQQLLAGLCACLPASQLSGARCLLHLSLIALLTRRN